jgi:hypothetical protein
MKNIQYKNPKSIIQVTEYGKVVAQFPSIAEAARQTGFRYDRILACANGQKKTYKGYFWLTQLSDVLKVAK